MNKSFHQNFILNLKVSENVVEFRFLGFKFLIYNQEITENLKKGL